MSIIGGSLGSSPNQILASGNSFTAELANQPFAVQNLTYSSSSSGTITVTVGVGRIEWADLQLDQFTSAQTASITSADSLGGATRHVVLVKGTSAGTPTISIDTSAPTQSNTNKQLLASFTLPSTVSTANNTILVDKRPQMTKGGGGGLLSEGDTSLDITDTGSNSSFTMTIDGTAVGSFTSSKLDYNGVFIAGNTLASNFTVASGKTAFTGGTYTVNNSVTLTLVGTLVIF
tara:strand:- start:1609 stop:2304 length:696 start_codon:yes stop_codon:yes gene_type:complete